MKKLIIVISFIIITINLSAQLNNFLPRNNAVMSILDQKYWFEGDTIIENMRYTKVYRQYCSTETECGDLEYYAAVREDTVAEKIYCIQKYDGVERLLADFNVKVGDRVILCSYTMTPYWWQGEEIAEVIEREVQIDAIDSILINNQYRKRLNYPSSNWWGGSSYDSIVEGIGNMEHGLFFMFDVGLPDVRAMPIFLCLHIDDDLIYQKPYYDTCYMKDNGLGINKINHFDFEIYPTIVKDRLFFKTNSNLVSYKIYNIQGKLCMAGISFDNMVSVSSLYQGIYCIASNNDGKIYTNKFIKQ